MEDLVVAIDQGTSSTRAILLDQNLDVVASAARAVNCDYPQPGWVEQDPEELVRTVCEVLQEVVSAAGVDPRRLAAIGIANQTETLIVWDRGTGRALHPAIVWQCRRTADIADALVKAGHEDTVRERTGLILGPNFPATKLRWLFDTLPELRKKAEAGSLAYGDVASWLLFRLGDGRRHVTEPSNASRSMLFNLSSRDWDPELLEVFGVPASVLPEIVPSGALGVNLSSYILGRSIPIAAALGDQQASLFGHRCWTVGQAKITLGTGAFAWANAGSEVPRPGPGVLASYAWQDRSGYILALEGFVPVAGAAITWMLGVGLIERPRDVDELAAQAVPSGVVCVPAFGGLGTPSWNTGIAGSWFGITLGTTKADLVRAVLDGIAHQVADAIEALSGSLPSGIDRISADGRVSKSVWLMQRIADLTGTPVTVAANPEMTAVGMGMFARVAVGLPLPELLMEQQNARVFDPDPNERIRRDARQQWSRAVQFLGGWE